MTKHLIASHRFIADIHYQTETNAQNLFLFQKLILILVLKVENYQY